MEAMFLTRNSGIFSSINFPFIYSFAERAFAILRNRRRTSDFIEQIPLAIIERHLFRAFSQGKLHNTTLHARDEVF